MKKEDIITLEIETPAIGKIITKVPYEQSCDGKDSDGFILKVPNRIFAGITDYTMIDLSMVVEHDIELFEKMNARNDENHQVHIDTLTIYGVQISGNYIRIQYWFDQFRDDKCHRMCAGVLTHSFSRGNWTHKDDFVERVFPECYSQDVAVYW